MGTTSTSGLRLRRVVAADSTLGRPMSSLPWSSWRWRLEASTVSKSTMPILPTPAAARYIEAGEPSPPAPSRSTLEASSLRCPAPPTSGRMRCRAYRATWSGVNPRACATAIHYTQGHPTVIPIVGGRYGNRIPRRRAGHRPLQQGEDREEDLADRHLDVARGAAVCGHDLRLLDPQRHGLEGLAGSPRQGDACRARGA